MVVVLVVKVGERGEVVVVGVVMVKVWVVVGLLLLLVIIGAMT